MISEYGQPARPAINVKCHAAGADFWPDALTREPFGMTDDEIGPGASYVDAAYNCVVSDFWQAAEEMADQRGLGTIYQAGRSGGWMVFELVPGDDVPCQCDGEHVQSPAAECPLAGWLAGYAAMREWAEAYIAAAPARVRDLAQGMAMDEIGSRAVALASIRAALR